MPTPTTGPSLAQVNQQQRQIIMSQAIEMRQQIYTGTVNPASSPTLNIQPRNVGLVKRFIIRIDATLANTGANVATLTDIGIANLLSQVTFTDLNNNVRIQTDGLHLDAIASVKRKHPFGGSADWNQTTPNGANLNRSQHFNVPPASWPVIMAPATIAAGAQNVVRAEYEVPLAYSDEDYRGAVYLNVLNATTNLALTFSNNAFAAAGTDASASVYAGSAGNITTAQVTVYQVWMDQLPVSQGKVVLPQLDLATIYELKKSTLTGVTQGNDFAIPYSNYRSFLSVFAVYNNGNAAGTPRMFGGDINYWALQSANFTNLWKNDPIECARMTREILGSDLPAGMYYFSHRRKNVETNQFGNIELIVNPITASPTAYVNVYWEDVAQQNLLQNAGSLASN